MPNPSAAFCFRVQLTGLRGVLSSPFFQDASGISVSTETQATREGGEDIDRHRLPTFANYQELVLKRAHAVEDDPFMTWCASCLGSGREQRIFPQTLTLQLLSSERSIFPLATILRQWSFDNVWPTKWSLTKIPPPKNELLIETVHFAYRTFSRLRSY